MSSVALPHATGHNPVCIAPLRVSPQTYLIPGSSGSEFHQRGLDWLPTPVGSITFATASDICIYTDITSA